MISALNFRFYQIPALILSSLMPILFFFFFQSEPIHCVPFDSPTCNRKSEGQIKMLHTSQMNKTQGTLIIVYNLEILAYKYATLKN